VTGLGRNAKIKARIGGAGVEIGDAMSNQRMEKTKRKRCKKNNM
jgi:hypothetical protein